MYSAIVCRVSVRPHPQADRLQLGTVAGSQVVIGLDIPDGTLGVFFPCDGKLSHDMCEQNCLYNESAVKALGLETGGTGEPHCGFFSASRRVRSQKFRGEKSEGFWTPLTSLSWTGYDITRLKDGDTFDELNGQVICEKYFTPATLRAMQAAKTSGRKIRDAMFPKHVDTGQWRYARAHIPEDAIIYLTEKQHGTSSRLGYVLETVERTWWRKILAYLAHEEPTQKVWTYLNGSKNVCLEKSEGAGYYGTNDFRYDVVDGITLHKGEILYGEIVGYVSPGVPIMAPQVIEDKELKKRYGPVMTYSYGCADGEHKLFIYRITRLNVDGVETDLSWRQVQQRCVELGLQTVREIGVSVGGDSDTLNALVEYETEGVSLFDDRHIREGVIVRVESAQGTTFLKSKGFSFGVLEGYIKSSDDYVDMEEAA